MLETKQIEYEDANYHLVITVKQGSLRDGMRRAALSTQARAAFTTMPEDLMDFYVPVEFFPAMKAGTHEIVSTGARELSLDFTLEEVMELPEVLVNAWWEAVWDLNPVWCPFPRGKAMTPNGSTPS